MGLLFLLDWAKQLCFDSFHGEFEGVDIGSAWGCYFAPLVVSLRQPLAEAGLPAFWPSVTTFPYQATGCSSTTADGIFTTGYSSITSAQMYVFLGFFSSGFGSVLPPLSP